MHLQRNKISSPSTFQVSLIVQAVFYVALGINHFWNPSFYVSVMPDHYSDPHALVLVSGAAEVLGGLGLLVHRTRRFSAWGLILMLLIYFDVHISMIVHAGHFPSIPLWLMVARLPVQFVLIGWALIYTRHDE